MSWLSCIFGHADRVRERDKDGNPLLTCPDCRHSIPLVSAEDVTKGPLHQQQPVLGQPMIKAARDWKPKAKKTA